MIKNKANSDNHSRLIKTPPFLILVLCVGGALGSGLFLGRQSENSNDLSTSLNSCPPCLALNTAGAKVDCYQEGYKSALDFARQKVNSIIPGAEGDVHVLSGYLKSVQDNGFVVTLDASQIDFFSEGSLDKIFVTNSNTLIEQSSDELIRQRQVVLEAPIPPSQIIKKSEDQTVSQPTNNLLPTNPTPPPAPSLTINKISIKDLKAGDMVDIKTESDINSPDPLVAISVRLILRSSDSK